MIQLQKLMGLWSDMPDILGKINEVMQHHDKWYCTNHTCKYAESVRIKLLVRETTSEM